MRQKCPQSRPSVSASITVCCRILLTGMAIAFLLPSGASANAQAADSNLPSPRLTFSLASPLNERATEPGNRTSATTQVVPAFCSSPVVRPRPDFQSNMPRLKPRPGEASVIVTMRPPSCPSGTTKTADENRMSEDARRTKDGALRRKSGHS
jgi:hypothetical protein